MAGIALLEHGGQLRLAAERYAIPLEQWLDLSTGVSPWTWPLSEIPGSSWQRLPETGDGLESAACEYYGCRSLLPVAGSQAAIQALPWLRSRCRVGLLSPSYSEHAQAWSKAGHSTRRLAADDIDAAVDGLDVVQLCQPNNPDGTVFEPAQLRDWHQRLAARRGWLLIDEAFMDATPEMSSASLSQQSGLIVLRSLGKFFGLAGARVGFVLANAELLDALHERLGPWTVSGPARYVARAALSDSSWQQAMRPKLRAAAQRLAGLLAEHGLRPTAGTALFQFVSHQDAQQIQHRLAQQGVLVRLFPELPALRFGLPAEAAQWQRLEQSLKRLG